MGKMADFEALNESRSETLRQIRGMISQEASLWALFFKGHDTSEMIAHLKKNHTRFRDLWDQHERIRQQMVDAGFMPPPVPIGDAVPGPVEVPDRHAIEDTLKAELDTARAEYYVASQEFRLLVVHGTGLPAPDGNLSAKQVAADHAAALRKYTKATRRFNAFLTDGKLPDEE